LHRTFLEAEGTPSLLSPAPRAAKPCAPRAPAASGELPAPPAETLAQLELALRALHALHEDMRLSTLVTPAPPVSDYTPSRTINNLGYLSLFRRSGGLPKHSEALPHAAPSTRGRGQEHASLPPLARLLLLLALALRAPARADYYLRQHPHLTALARGAPPAPPAPPGFAPALATELAPPDVFSALTDALLCAAPPDAATLREPCGALQPTTAWVVGVYARLAGPATAPAGTPLRGQGAVGLVAPSPAAPSASPALLTAAQLLRQTSGFAPPPEALGAAPRGPSAARAAPARACEVLVEELVALGVTEHDIAVLPGALPSARSPWRSHKATLLRRHSTPFL
jgi:hypothetical protein